MNGRRGRGRGAASRDSRRLRASTLLRARALAAFSLCALSSVCTHGQDTTPVLSAHTFATDGHPGQALFTPDGQYVLVTVTHDGRLGSGVEVFRIQGEKLKRVALNPLGTEPAQGILLIPHTRTLAVGLSNDGVAFLPLDATLTGRAAAHVIPQGEHPGSSLLAVTPDGKTLFVANPSLRGGAIGVLALRRDPKGELAPVAIGQIPTPLGTAGLALSPDGTRLYALNELLTQGQPQRLPGHATPELQHVCPQADPTSPRINGGLFVIDVARATAPTNDFSPQQQRDATLQVINAGCSPARVAVASSGRTVYVTARGDSNVLALDAADLEHLPDRAFISAISSGGTAPVGLALLDHDRKLLVANTSRFETGPGSVVVLDLTAAGHPILQTLGTGDGPLNLTASPDGRTFALTLPDSDELMLLTMM